MARATQMLAYHGRTALLLGPMPRRAIPPVANLSAALRPLVDVSDLARTATLKTASGLTHPAHNKLLETTVIPLSGSAVSVGRNADFPAAKRLGAQKPSPKDGSRGQV